MAGVSAELPPIGGAGVSAESTAEAGADAALAASGGGGVAAAEKARRQPNKRPAARSSSSSRSRQPAVRRARSMVDIRREVRKEIAGPLAARREERRKKEKAARRASSSMGLAPSQAPSFMEASGLQEPEPEHERLSRLSMSSRFLADLDLSVLTSDEPEPEPEEPQMDEFGRPLPQPIRYSKSFMQALLGATPRDTDGPTAEEEAAAALEGSLISASEIQEVIGPVLDERVLKPRTGRLSYAREPAPEWWDWDIKGGGVGGRWADDEPAKPGPGGPPPPAAEAVAADPAAEAEVSERDELETTLQAVMERSAAAGQRRRQSKLHKQRLVGLSQKAAQSVESFVAQENAKYNEVRLPSIVKGLKLNAEQMEALKSAFRECDPEDDGLTCSEFCEFFDPIVDDDTPAELKVLFLKMDASANGQLTCDEFLSYLLKRSSADADVPRPSLLTDVSLEQTGEEDPLLQKFGVKPLRSEVSHGAMIDKLISIPMSTGDIPLFYATTGRPGPRGVREAEAPGMPVPETSVTLWRASDLLQYKTLPASMLISKPQDGIAEDDAVGFLPLSNDNVAALLDKSLSLDSKEATNLLGARRHLLESTARLIDVLNWPQRRSIAILLDNKLMSPYLSVIRHKDLIGERDGTKIERINLQNMPASPNCFFLCEPASTQPQSSCPDTFLIGDTEGNVSCYRPDGSRLSTGQWHKSAVSSVRLITVRQGELCRVVSIGSGDDARVMISDSATWKVLKKSAPVPLGIRSFDHSPACSIIVTGGADRTVRVWQDDSLALNAELNGHKAVVADVAVNESALHFASCDASRCVRVWHLHTYQCVQSVADLDPHPPENKLSSLMVDMTSERLVAAGAFLSIWGVQPKPGAKEMLSPSTRSKMKPQGHTTSVVSLAYSHRFGQFISLCEGGEVHVNEFQPRFGTAPRLLTFNTSNGHEGSLLSAGALDSNGSRLFTGSGNGLVRLWNINSGEAMVEEMSEAEAKEFVVRAGDIPPGRHEAPPVEITNIRWLAGSNASSNFHLMAVGWGAAVMLWKDPAIPHGRPLQLKIPPAGADRRGRSGANTGVGQATDVLCSCCAPKLFLACGTADGRVMAWFFASGDLRIRSVMPKEVIMMPPQEGGNQPCPAEILFWLGGSRALLAIGSGRMHFLSVYSGEVAVVDVAVLDGLCAAALSDDGHRLVAGTSTGEVVVYDVSDVHDHDKNFKLPEIGRCVIHAGPRRITSLAVCGHKEKPQPRHKKHKRQMKPLPGMAKYAPVDADAADEVEVVPEAPDWILVGCEDGAVFVCTGDGTECLGLIDEVDLVRIAREKKEEEERLAAEAAAAAEEARLLAEEEKAKKEAEEGKKKGGKRGRGGR
jgi:WD40 repeat protein